MPAKADWRIAAVARAANICERTSRRWRDLKDPRWDQAMERIGSLPDKSDSTAAIQAAAADGLHDGVSKLSKLADELAAKISIDDADTRSGLIRDYTAVLDQLRKLRSESPEIAQAEGSVVPFDEADKVLAQRDAVLIPLLRGMPRRLAVVCANRPAAEVQNEIENEVGQIMRQVESALS
ncbi:hypothetical protein EBZ80_24365 [bacterium]|nr:hypothetical protein [bacterium]